MASVHDTDFVHVRPSLAIRVVGGENASRPRFHEDLIAMEVCVNRKYSTETASTHTFRNVICALSNVKSSSFFGNGPSNPYKKLDSIMVLFAISWYVPGSES